MSETTANTRDEISETRQYETRRDREVWAGSHNLPRSTGIQASRSREPVTFPRTAETSRYETNADAARFILCTTKEVIYRYQRVGTPEAGSEHSSWPHLTVS